MVTTFNKTVFNPLHNMREVDSFGERALPDLLPFGPDLAVRFDNLKRAREKVFDIALMNNFDYFVTLTIDPKKVNSFDEDEVGRVVRKWFKNMVQRYDVKYVAVPEYHKSGRIHWHCLMSGNLKYVDSGTVLIPNRKKPVKSDKAIKLCPDLSKHRKVYNLLNWHNGHSTLIEFEKCDDGINGTMAIAKYLTKYITKDLIKVMKHYYYAGGDIQRDVQTDYRNVNFDLIDAPAIDVKDTVIKVKYQTIGVV